MTKQNSATHRYIRFVLDSLKLTPGGLAKMAGVAPSTLTRFLNDHQYKFNLSTTTLNKISNVTNISPAPFYGDDAVRNVLSYIYDPLNSNYAQIRNNTTMVIGEIASGVWNERILYTNPVFYDPISIIDSEFSPKRFFAFVVKGNSCNKIAEDGDYLLCTAFDVYFSTATLGEGHILVIERLSDNEKLSELSARVVRKVKGKLELHSLSSDPRFKVAIDMPNVVDPTSKIRVLGVVTWVARDMISKFRISKIR